MNERIRQLADEAGLRFTQLLSKPMIPVVDGKVTDLEKFAELIVQEFAELIVKESAKLIVRECGVALNPMLRNMISRGQAYDLIKQHFEVEE